MKKIFYWSPYLSNVATIKNVLNSAMSMKKYTKKSLNISIIDVVGEWSKYEKEIQELRMSLNCQMKTEIKVVFGFNL